MFCSVPGSRADDVTGRWCVEAIGAGDVLRVVSFAVGETDEGLDVAQPIVVEGVLVVIRHPGAGQVPGGGRSPGAVGAAGAERRQRRGRFLWQSSKRFFTISGVPVLTGRG